MNTKKHVLSLFTKAPSPGFTKTRLTIKHGGILNDGEAADLYHAMILDVAGSAFQALDICRLAASNSDSKDEYTFFISCTSESDQSRLKVIFETEHPQSTSIHYIVDHGRNFDEHFNDHFRQLFSQGYHSVVCIGGDLPTLSPELICRTFQWLSYLEKTYNKGALVIAPCQAAGVSIVGLTDDASIDFTGVFYNNQGISALDAIINVAAERQIPTVALETQHDVDTMEDLAHITSVINAMEYTQRYQSNIHLPQNTWNWITRYGLSVQTPPNSEHDPRGYIDENKDR